MKKIIFTSLLIILALCKNNEAQLQATVLRQNTELSSIQRITKELKGYLQAKQSFINTKLMESYDAIEPHPNVNMVGLKYTVCIDAKKSNTIVDTIKVVVTKDSAGRFTFASLSIEDCE